MEEIIFPNQIRMQRRLKGMSMQELADHLGVSLSAISKIEKGYRRLNQEQLIQVAELTDCTLQDLYVNEHNSQSEVVLSWRREQERRNKMNIDAGLKILGAGLRHIRTDRGQTLMEIAERADMTLSVYHRIEMGQREVSEREFKNIAKAFSFESVEDLKAAVDALDKDGKLDEIMERTDTKFKLLSTPKGGTVSMYGIPTNEALKIKIFGTPAKDGNIIINKEDKDAKEIARPANLLYKREAYGLNLCTRRLGNLLPTRAILFADPQDVVSIGDIAVYYIDDVTVQLLSIREDESGQLYGMRFNPDEKIILTDDDLSKMHKVVAINL
ncbi:MAG: helix-turn-helix domain-containing protein [Alphaproteobacteria bacterium]|nr:helix-turn-helix domain-containing protein [Alphaproteobacteria bacterium]